MSPDQFAEAISATVEAAVDAEREACAQLADPEHREQLCGCEVCTARRYIASSIRARGIASKLAAGV